MFSASELLYVKELDVDWLAEAISEKFDNALDLMTKNAVVYGGAIRDLLAGMPLKGDLDIAVPPEELEEITENFQSSSKWMIVEKDGEEVTIPNPNPVGVRDRDKKPDRREPTIREAIVGSPGQRSALFPNSSYSRNPNKYSAGNILPGKPKKSQRSPYRKGRGKLVLSGVLTFKMSGNIKVQIMSAKRLNEMLNVMASDPFQIALCPARAVDIRCCGLAMDRSGRVLEIVEGAYNDCLEKILRLNKISVDDSFENLSARVEKLIDRGWASEINLERAKKEINKIKGRKQAEEKRQIERQKRREKKEMEKFAKSIKAKHNKTPKYHIYKKPLPIRGHLLHDTLRPEGELFAERHDGLPVMRLSILSSQIKSSLVGNPAEYLGYKNVIRGICDQTFSTSDVMVETKIVKTQNGDREEALVITGTEQGIAALFTLVEDYWSHHRIGPKNLIEFIESLKGVNTGSIPNNTNFHYVPHTKKATLKKQSTAPKRAKPTMHDLQMKWTEVDEWRINDTFDGREEEALESKVEFVAAEEVEVAEDSPKPKKSYEFDGSVTGRVQLKKQETAKMYGGYYKPNPTGVSPSKIRIIKNMDNDADNRIIELEIRNTPFLHGVKKEVRVSIRGKNLELVISANTSESGVPVGSNINMARDMSTIPNVHILETIIRSCRESQDMWLTSNPHEPMSDTDFLNSWSENLAAQLTLKTETTKVLSKSKKFDSIIT